MAIFPQVDGILCQLVITSPPVEALLLIDLGHDHGRAQRRWHAEKMAERLFR